MILESTPSFKKLPSFIILYRQKPRDSLSYSYEKLVLWIHNLVNVQKGFKVLLCILEDVDELNKSNLD